MTKNMIKKIILASFFSVMLLTPALVFADSFGIDEAAKTGGLKEVSLSQKSVPEVIGDIVGVVLSLLGVVFFLLILYAGIMWMTAFGVAEKAEKSKEILIQASVGLIIVLSAYAISSFVFSRLGAGGGEQTGPAVNCAQFTSATECNTTQGCLWSPDGNCFNL